MKDKYIELNLDQLIAAKEVYQDCFEKTGNEDLLMDVESVSNEISRRYSLEG